MSKKIVLNSVSVFENEDGTEDFLNFKEVEDVSATNDGPVRFYDVEMAGEILQFNHMLKTNVISLIDDNCMPVLAKQLTHPVVPINQYSESKHIDAIAPEIESYVYKIMKELVANPKAFMDKYFPYSDE